MSEKLDSAQLDSTTAARSTPLTRQSEFEATREAADMADRWQKTFLRNFRALRDLRRFASHLVIRNAVQVNVANQQLNVQG